MVLLLFLLLFYLLQFIQSIFLYGLLEFEPVRIPIPFPDQAPIIVPETTTVSVTDTIPVSVSYPVSGFNLMWFLKKLYSISQIFSIKNLIFIFYESRKLISFTC